MLIKDSHLQSKLKIKVRKELFILDKIIDNKIFQQFWFVKSKTTSIILTIFHEHYIIERTSILTLVTNLKHSIIGITRNANVYKHRLHQTHQLSATKKDTIGPHYNESSLLRNTIQFFKQSKSKT